jgi:hypothetical protein
VTLRKNVASQKLVFTLVNATTGAALTGATVTAKLSIDGGASATATGAVAELANGQYAWSPDAADTNGTVLGVQFTATNAVPRAFTVYTVNYDTTAATVPANTTHFGGTAGTFAAGRPEVNTTHWRGTAVSEPTVEGVPDVNVKTWNDLATVALPLVPSTPGRTLNLNVTGQADADVVMWDGESVATPDTAGYPKVTIKDGTGQGELDITSGVTKANTVEFGGMAGTFNAGIPEVKTNALSANTITADSIAADAGAELADALLDLSAGVETGLTLRQAIRLLVAANAGKLSGAATTTITIRNAVADDKNRITATVDEDGNRSAITYDLT